MQPLTAFPLVCYPAAVGIFPFYPLPPSQTSDFCYRLCHGLPLCIIDWKAYLYASACRRCFALYMWGWMWTCGGRDKRLILVSTFLGGLWLKRGNLLAGECTQVLSVFLIRFLKKIFMYFGGGKVGVQHLRYKYGSYTLWQYNCKPCSKQWSPLVRGFWPWHLYHCQQTTNKGPLQTKNMFMVLKWSCGRTMRVTNLPSPS